ncbi:MAG: hypothetical protein KAT07_11075 [Calditrichia bacterium]|nr:hypothetical protein [Calditrichia bacterium]
MPKSVQQNCWIHLILSLSMIYVLLAFPLLSTQLDQSHKKHLGHQHACPCGCQGDMVKCMCEKSTGIVGFRFCTSEVNLLFTVLYPWDKRNIDRSLLSAQLLKEILNIPLRDVLKFQEFYKPIEHPPKSYM